MGLIFKFKEAVERVAGLKLGRRAGFPFVTARRRFLNVRMDLQNRCNLRCSICYYAFEEIRRQPLERLGDDLLDALAREIWPRTGELWVSCGFEPLMVPNLADVIRCAKAAGIPTVRLVTNGLLLDEAKARALIESGLDGMMVSLDGASKAVYEAIRKGSDFERVIANLRRFQSLKREAGRAAPELMINCVMTADNIGEWPALVELAADLGAVWISLAPQTAYAGMEPERILRDLPEAVNAALIEARAVAARRGIDFWAPGGFDLSNPAGIGGSAALPRYCEAPWLSLTVLPGGEVIPCYPMSGGNRVFGNLRTHGFNQIYYGRAMQAIRESMHEGRPHPICQGCALWHHSDLNQASTWTVRKVLPGQAEEAKS